MVNIWNGNYLENWVLQQEDCWLPDNGTFHVSDLFERFKDTHSDEMRVLDDINIRQFMRAFEMEAKIAGDKKRASLQASNKGFSITRTEALALLRALGIALDEATLSANVPKLSKSEHASCLAVGKKIAIGLNEDLFD